MKNEKIEITIVGLDVSTSSPANFVLMLEEQATQRKIPLVIGSYEANAIAIHLEKMAVPRPLAHDLFCTYLQLTRSAVKEVLICDIVDGLFIAEVTIETVTHELIKLDSRASDAILLALKFDSPIYMDRRVVEATPFLEMDNGTSALKGSWKEFSLDELHSLLAKLIAKEDYESAGRIRDFILSKGGSVE